nr:MAG TPA: hypothetical protein [Bacteriophage sp.]
MWSIPLMADGHSPTTGRECAPVRIRVVHLFFHFLFLLVIGIRRQTGAFILCRIEVTPWQERQIRG